ncbi:hypothetical protein SprV_0702367900 [Sparganum proliferum]
MISAGSREAVKASSWQTASASRDELSAKRTNYLVCLGGRNTDDFVKRVFYVLFDDEASIHVNFRGKKTKEGLCGSQVYEVIKDVYAAWNKGGRVDVYELEAAFTRRLKRSLDALRKRRSRPDSLIDDSDASIGNVFGRDALRSARRWETFALREGSTYSQILFLHRCLDNNVLPKCVSYKPPVNTDLARRAVFQYGRRMIRVLLKDRQARLRKYRQRIDQEKIRCCEFMGEIGTKLLLQRIAEQAREQRMLRDAAQENKFRKLFNPTSSRNDKLVHNLSSKELTKDQMQVLRREASFNTADAKPVNMIAAVESILSQTEATEETKSLIRHQVSSLLMAHRPREVLSKVERDALRELKADKDLIILPADKGRSTVALDRTDYLQKAKCLLEDRQCYVPCATNLVKALTREINATLSALENSGAITPTDRRMARPQDTALALYHIPC